MRGERAHDFGRQALGHIGSGPVKERAELKQIAAVRVQRMPRKVLLDKQIVYEFVLQGVKAHETRSGARLTGKSNRRAGP